MLASARKIAVDTTAMLTNEIAKTQRLVRTDAYTMSIGEIVSMYDNREIVIDPEFQRLFRWDISQKSKLIESILLGILSPPSSCLRRTTANGNSSTVCSAFRQSLSSWGSFAALTVGWSRRQFWRPQSTFHRSTMRYGSGPIAFQVLPIDEQQEIDKGHQLSIRRARIGVEILKRPSNDQTKYDLFQQLNAGGTQANAQELRNCIMLMVSGEYYRAIKAAAEQKPFQTVVSVTEEQIERQRHMELAVRFLVHTFVPYDGMLDVEEYIDNGIVELAKANNGVAAENLINRTFAPKLCGRQGRATAVRKRPPHWEGRPCGS